MFEHMTLSEQQRRRDAAPTSTGARTGERESAFCAKPMIWISSLGRALLVLATGFWSANALAVDLGGAVTNNFQAWEPTTASWVPGNATGYAEGEVVAFSFENTVSGVTPNTQYQVALCFEYDYAGGGTNYAFIDLQPWDTYTAVPPLLRVPTQTITSSLDGVSTDWGTIDSVVAINPTTVACDANSLAYDVTLTTGAAPGPGTYFYIYFGNRVAQQGLQAEVDPPYGGVIVPANGGVASWPVGTFQARLQRVTGQKTVNFKPGDFSLTIQVIKQVDTDGDGTPDVIGGPTANDSVLSGYEFQLCPDGVAPDDPTCLIHTTDTTGYWSVAVTDSTNYELYEVPPLPSGYEFVTWEPGSLCTNLGGTNNQAEVTVATVSGTCYVTNRTVPDEVCRILRLTSTSVTGFFGSGAFNGTFTAPSPGYDLVIDTTTFGGLGYVMNDGQFPVSVACDGSTEDCFGVGTQAPNPFNSVQGSFAWGDFDLSVSTDTIPVAMTLGPGTKGGGITFTSGGTYSYTGNSDGIPAHTGTYAETECIPLPEPGTIALMCLPLVGLAAARRRRRMSA